MRGIILAGGLGTRLGDLTKITNKHLLPVFDRPMIYYPIKTLVSSGITEIMIIVSGPHSGSFIPILKNGEELGITKLEYAYQSKPDGGIADALALAENFAGNEKIAVILGDNIFDEDFKFYFKLFDSIGAGAEIFLKEVENLRELGVPRFENGVIKEIIEKPSIPPSDYAVLGLYLYDSNVFSYIKECSPSARKQLEITDVNNLYLNKGELRYRLVDGFWKDAGTYDNLLEAGKYMYSKQKGSK